jgi:hypothetical protein
LASTDWHWFRANPLPSGYWLLAGAVEVSLALVGGHSVSLWRQQGLAQPLLKKGGCCRTGFWGCCRDGNNLLPFKINTMREVVAVCCRFVTVPCFLTLLPFRINDIRRVVAELLPDMHV